MTGAEPTAVVHTSRRKVRRRHPWVFANEVVRIEGQVATGDLVRVVDQGHYAGNALYSQHSLIRARIYSRSGEPLDLELIRRRLATADGLRRQVLSGEQDFRLLYGESDQLPGLVIDKYRDHFVLQVYSAGMESRTGLVIEALRSLLPVESVTARNDFRLREAEGLMRYDRLLYGKVPETVTIAAGGVRYAVSIVRGQKTGFYFDQRVTRSRVRALSSGRDVLDVFCYSGGFAINAALGGARQVLAVDGAEESCALAQHNVELNQVGDRVEVIRHDAFDFLRELNEQQRRFGLVVLDPPSFVKRAQEKARGMKGYLDINYQAMKLLVRGGILVSCSCSHHVTWQDLLSVISRASQGCGREFRILERVGAGPDHPVLLSMPETEYLRCYILQLV